MKIRAIVVFAIAAVLFGLYSSIALAYPTFTWRYRLTVEVDVDGQMKSGSGVIEVSATVGPAWLRPINSGGEAPKVKGEAVSVDLGARGILFVLLDGGPHSDANSLAEQTFAAQLPKPSGDRIAHWTALSKLQASAELSVDALPTLATFKDARDPKSAIRVNPRDLAAGFRPGVQLKRVVIEMTKDPITIAIDKTLPWLSHTQTNEYIEGVRLSSLSPSGLHFSAFKRGL